MLPLTEEPTDKIAPTVFKQRNVTKTYIRM